MQKTHIDFKYTNEISILRLRQNIEDSCGPAVAVAVAVAALVAGGMCGVTTQRLLLLQ